MRVLVTGGAGFIGSNLVDRLVSDGATVLVVDNLSTGREANLADAITGGAHLVQMDITDPSLAAQLGSFHPEVVYHLAAQASVIVSVADPVLDTRVNVLGTVNVLAACAANRVRKIVFASSGGTVYGEPAAEDLPVSETYAGRPLAPYGIAKRVIHDYLHFFAEVRGLDFTALALANVYGPRQDPYGEAGVVAIWSERLLSGAPCEIFGDGEQTRDFVFVGDVVDAFARAAGRGGGSIINIGTGIETSVNEVYRQMATAAGVDAAPRYSPARPGEMKRIALDVRRAGEILDWRPRASLDSGIATTVDWFRGHRR